MGKKKSVTVGFWYYIGMFMGICRGPVNAIRSIKVGDRIARDTPITNSGSYYIDQPELFGGETGEGGVQGTLDVMFGYENQTAVSRLVTMIGRALPGFRGRTTVFFDGKFTAMNPYPKKWSFRIQRHTAGWDNNFAWYIDKARIVMGSGAIEAMNPAHIIFECLTNRQWGRGLPWDRLDQVAFQIAADTLYAENFGLCLKWSRRDSLKNFLGGVLDHIGAGLYTDRTTGLLKLRLIRRDYVHGALPKYDMTNGLLSITDAAVNALPNQINQVVVKYKDPILNQERAVRTQSLAGIQASNGEINLQTNTYPGIPTGDLALLTAQRDLNFLVLPLRRFKLEFDRRGWNIQPTDVFRIANPARGLQDIVVRVGQVEDGTLTNGRITVTVIQDQYSMPLTAFSGFQPPVWVPPDRSADLKRHRVFELTYRDLAATMPPADFNFITPDGAYLGAVVEKPTPLSINYDMAIKQGSADPDEYPVP